MMSQIFPSKKFVRVWSGKNKYAEMVPKGEVSQYENPKYEDLYGSLSYYSKEHEAEFKKSGSVKGITGLKTDKIWFDLDMKEDLESCKKSTIQLVDTIVYKGYSQDCLEIYFSGQKGFHVIMNLDQEIPTTKVKDIAMKFGKDIPGFDLTVYDEARILRLPFTQHSKTKLYKIPVSYEDLRDLSIDQIKTKASSVPEVKKESRKKVKLTDDLMKVEVPQKKETVSSLLEIRKDDPLLFSALDFTRKPRDWKSDAKWALSQGRFAIGDRHKVMMILGSTCKALHYNELQTRGWLEAANQLHCDITGDKVDTDEIDKTIEAVFDESWKGGQYSRKSDAWLDNYCVVNGLDDDKNEDAPISISDISESFKHFVVNIDKNTIKTGIKELDDAIPITIGMNLGIIGAASSGKCLGKDTGVRMYDGSVKMVQDVLVGDLLMGDDSTPRKVLSLARGEEQMYKVSQANGNQYIVNESHILSLKCGRQASGSRKIKFIKDKIVDINIKSYLNESKEFKRHFKGYKVGVEYKETETELDPYFVGLWLGDGDKNEPRITNNDKEIHEYLFAYADKLNLKINKHVDNRTNAVTIRLTNGKIGNKSNILTEKLKKDNLYQNKRIPNNYLINSRINRLKLLAGLIDSDGHLSETNHYEFTLSKTDLVKDITDLVRSLGYKCTVKSKIGGCYYKGIKKEAEYCRFYINGNDMSEIPVLLERKKSKNIVTRNILSTSIKIEKLDVDNYYGFQIDGNHRFLLEDYTVTHNTAMSLEILRNTSMNGVVSVIASLDMHRNRLFEKLLYKVSNDVYGTPLTRHELYELFKNNREEKLLEEIKKQYGNVYFYDRSRPTVEDISNFVKIVEKQTTKKVKLIMIDYFERISSDITDATASSLRVANELQDLINDLNVALITLVQPNKMSLAGGPDSAILSYTSIKGSSFLYQAFRGIISIWRPFFTPDTKDDDKFLEMAILKNDLGELDKFKFNWDGKTGSIFPMTQDDELRYAECMDRKRENMQQNAGNGNGATPFDSFIRRGT